MRGFAKCRTTCKFKVIRHDNHVLHKPCCLVACVSDWPKHPSRVQERLTLRRSFEVSVECLPHFFEFQFCSTDSRSMQGIRLYQQQLLATDPTVHKIRMNVARLAKRMPRCVLAEIRHNYYHDLGCFIQHRVKLVRSIGPKLKAFLTRLVSLVERCLFDEIMSKARY